MEKVGLKIVQLLHDISQLDYQVQFCGDFKNMVRIEYRKEYEDSFYEHTHLGYPDGSMEHLEKAIIKELHRFYINHEDD